MAPSRAVATPSSASAPQGATGTCRDPRRESRGGAHWARSFERAHYALNASLRLIDLTLRALAASERRAARQPVRTSRNLHDASGLLVTASARLQRAAEWIAAATELMAVAPECATRVPQLLIEATVRWALVAERLGVVADQVFGLHNDVLDGLETGQLVPERPAVRRPRIVLIPRPASVCECLRACIRAFLPARQPRVSDRITPVLRRRRRAPRPTSVRVPRRTSQGRAPPLSPVCLL